MTLITISLILTKLLTWEMTQTSTSKIPSSYHTCFQHDKFIKATIVSKARMTDVEAKALNVS